MCRILNVVWLTAFANLVLDLAVRAPDVSEESSHPKAFHADPLAQNASNTSNNLLTLTSLLHMNGFIGKTKTDVVFKARSGFQLDMISRCGITAVILLVSFAAVTCVNSIKATVDETPEEEAPVAPASSEVVEAPSVPPPVAPASSVPPEDPNDTLTFIAVTRVNDRSFLTKSTTNKDPAKLEYLTKTCVKLCTLASRKEKNFTGGCKSNFKLAAPCTGTLFYSVDTNGEYMSFVAAATKVTDNVGTNCLSELMKEIDKRKKELEGVGKGTEDEKLKAFSSSLMSQHAVAGVRKKSAMAGQALNKMGTIKSTMKQNMAVVQTTGDSLSLLEKNSKNMDNMSKAFNKTAETAAWKHLLAKYQRQFQWFMIIFDIVSIYLVWYQIDNIG